VGAALWLQAAGAAMLGACGAIALLAGRSFGSGFTSEITPALGVDPLTGAFLAIIALVAAPAAIAAASTLRGARGPTLAALTGLFTLTLAGVVTARDPSFLLGFWELMTLVPAAAMLVASGGETTRRAVYQYLAVTHLGGVGVWIAVLALARYGAIGDPAGLAASSGVRAVVLVAAIVGFGTKAGLVPFHSWLPRAHPVAPSHLSAVMSGVMVKVALYGLIRVLFEWVGAPPLWSGLVILAVGAASALGGVVAALLQRELKRLLAYSTIENVGVIALGLGAAVVLADRGEPTWSGVAMAAALLHATNHAAFKGLLFLGAGAIQRAAGVTDIDRLGGLLRRMPRAAVAFGIGLLAIAGVPPLNGFASEWMTLQGLAAVGRDGGVGVALAGAIGLAALAATAALAVLCFARVGGLALLGAPRSPDAGTGDAPGTVRTAMGALAFVCVALGVLPGLVVPSLARLAPGAPELPRGAGIDLPGTSLGTLGVAVALAVAAGALLALRGRRVAAPAPVWACGQPVDASLRWTSAGFTKTFLLSAEPVLRAKRTVTVDEDDGVVRSVTRTAKPRRPDAALYAPAVRAALSAARVARRIQSGDLRAYVAYLVGVVVLLLALARAGALG
jgi:hydrogenase-4 component B